MRPRPRGESVLTRKLIVTVGLAGLAITIGLLLLIGLGTSRFGNLDVARSVAVTSFALCLIVAALECRNQTETVLTLKPGKHTLQLVLGDSNHIPHDPPVTSEKITIWVK